MYVGVARERIMRIGTYGKEPFNDAQRVRAISCSVRCEKGSLLFGELACSFDDGLGSRLGAGVTGYFSPDVGVGAGGAETDRPGVGALPRGLRLVRRRRSDRPAEADAEDVTSKELAKA